MDTLVKSPCVKFQIERTNVNNEDAKAQHDSITIYDIVWMDDHLWAITGFKHTLSVAFSEAGCSHKTLGETVGGVKTD